MSQLHAVLSAYPRIHFACHPRHVREPDAEGGVTAKQADILAHLDDVDPAMVGELADHLGVTDSTMSLNLTRLEDAGYVRRDRDPADRRVMNVRLTEAGVAVRDARRMLDPLRVDAMLRLLSVEERERAVEGLRLLARAADDLVRRGPGAARTHPATAPGTGA